MRWDHWTTSLLEHCSKSGVSINQFYQIWNKPRGTEKYMLPLQAQKQNWQLAQQMPLLQLSAAKHDAPHNYAVHIAAQSWKVVFATFCHAQCRNQLWARWSPWQRFVRFEDERVMLDNFHESMDESHWSHGDFGTSGFPEAFLVSELQPFEKKYNMSKFPFPK